MPVIIDGTLGVNASAITTTNWTPTNITTGGNTTLGDASGDTVTINASTVSIPNGLNFDSNTLFIDSPNDKVGVGIASSLGAKLDVRNTSATTGLRVFTNDVGTAKVAEFKGYDNTLGEVTRFTVQANGWTGVNTASPNRLFSVVGYDSTTSSADVSSLMRITHNTSGTPVAGIATGIQFAAQSLSGTDREVADILAVMTDVTAGADKGALTFRTATNNSLTEKMRIDSTGNVGIGVIPSALFGKTLMIGGVDSSSLGLTGGIIYSSASGNNIQYASGSSANGAHIFNGAYTGAEYMRIDGSGNLKLGTTGYGTKAVIYGTNTAIGTTVSGTNTGLLMLVDANSAANAGPEVVFTSQYDGGGVNTIPGASLKSYKVPASGSGSDQYNHGLIFKTSSYARGSLAESMRIDHNGKVMIGMNNGQSTFNAYNANGGAPATSGSTDTTTVASLINGVVGLDFGHYTSGTAWVQNRTFNNYATNYDLALQPNGGNVGIGTSGQSAKLSVYGSAGRFSELLGNTMQVRIAASEGGWASFIGFANNAGTFLGGILGAGTSQAMDTVRLGTGSSPSTIIIDSANTVTTNKIKEYTTTFYIQGYTAQSWDIPIPDCSANGNFIEVVAGYNHYAGPSYGAWLRTMVSYRSSGSLSIYQDDIKNWSSGGGGSWSVSVPNGTTLRVTKNAGSYSGGGYGYIIVTFNSMT